MLYSDIHEFTHLYAEYQLQEYLLDLRIHSVLIAKLNCENELLQLLLRRYLKFYILYFAGRIFDSRKLTVRLKKKSVLSRLE